MMESKALDAEVRGSRWLADGNAAMEKGNTVKAEKCYAKGQFWLDRYNKLTGRGEPQKGRREELQKMNKVIEAARCIRHWHDSANDGMVVSGEHVRLLWAALNELDA